MWLVGSSDLANLNADLYQLLTGGMAAGTRGVGQTGNAAIVSGVDAWTGLDATNHVIRSKATEKPRAEWTSWRGAPRFAYRGISPSNSYDVLRGRPTFSGTYTNGGTNPKVVIICWVSTVNSSAGNLGGTVVSYQMHAAGGNGTALFTGTLTGWAGGSDTKLIRDGISLTLTLSGGETLAVGTSAISWIRGYSATYTDGVDYWHDGANVVTGNTVVLSDTTGGTNDYTLATDYEFVQQADLDANLGYMGSFCAFGHSAMGLFSGIHWKSGGSPTTVGTDYFVVDCDLYIGYLKIDTLNQYVLIQPHDFYDVANTRGRGVADTSFENLTNGFRVVSISNFNLNLSNTIGQSYPSTVFVNFWISIKRDKVIVILKMDAAQTSPNTSYASFYFGKFDAKYPSVDFSPWIFIPSSSAGNMGGQGPGSCLRYNRPGCVHPYYGIATTTQPNGGNNSIWSLRSSIGTPQLDVIAPPVTSSIAHNPNIRSGLWDQWIPAIFDLQYGEDTNGNIIVAQPSGLTGTLPGIFNLSSSAYNTLDELVDGSNVYLLFTSSTGGLDLQTLFGSQGAAIFEE